LQGCWFCLPYANPVAADILKYWRNKMNTKRICAYEKGHVNLKEEAIEEPKKSEVLVETLYSTISPGTELAWLNHMQNTPGEYPFYPGYSNCGKVLAIGTEVENLQVGDIVACNAKHCSHYIAKAADCTPVPASITPREASAFRLASISLQGVRKADIQIGEDVAVLGLGAIGNFAAQLAKAAGAGSVTGFDFVDWRRALGSVCGIDILLPDGERPEFKNRYEVIIEATGVPQAVNTALKMVKPQGTVILLGSARGKTDGVDFYSDVHKKGVTIVGAHEMYRSKNESDRFGHFKSHKADEETVIKLLAGKRIKLAPLISETVRPEDAQSIYDRLMAKEGKLVLAAFEWGTE
jgi:2-desacetyl-2-hydroxyethyl bacteriochlorophyllide A dehydrogenase